MAARRDWYRKLEIAEHGAFAALPFMTRAVAAMLLKHADAEGRFPLGGRDPVDAIGYRAGATKADRAAIRQHLPRLFEVGYIRVERGALIVVELDQGTDEDAPVAVQSSARTGEERGGIRRGSPPSPPRTSADPQPILGTSGGDPEGVQGGADESRSRDHSGHGSTKDRRGEKGEEGEETRADAREAEPEGSPGAPGGGSLELFALGPSAPPEPARRPRAKTKASPPAAPKEPREESPMEIGWRTFRAEHARATGRRSYLQTPACGAAMKRVTAIAMQACEDADRGGPEDIEQLFAHWWARYFADDDRFIAEKGHAIRFIEPALPKYGTPWDPGYGANEEASDGLPRSPRSPPGPHPIIAAMLAEDGPDHVPEDGMIPRMDLIDSMLDRIGRGIDNGDSEPLPAPPPKLPNRVPKPGVRYGNWEITPNGERYVGGAK